MCRFLGCRVAAFERGALFAGVRETPRHEIAGAVRGGLPTAGPERRELLCVVTRKFLFPLFEIEHRIDVVFYADRGTICSMDTLTWEKHTKRLDLAKRLVR